MSKEFRLNVRLNVRLLFRFKEKTNEYNMA